MRLLMMGTGPFAVPTFEALLESSHDLIALVTRPVPPARGRRKGSTNPMRDVAVTRNVPILAPANVNDSAVIDQLAQLQPDLLVVCDYGQILSRAALGISPLGGINLHGSLLPEYRGAAPVHWAVWDGKQQTGVTIIHMTPKLDGGPCLCRRNTPIAANETTEQLEPRLAVLGVAPVMEAITLLEKWDRQSPIGIVQDKQQATKAPRLKKSDGRVDWTQPAERIVNQVRALKPWPNTFTIWHNEKGEVLRLILDQVCLSDHDAENAAPGEVLVSDGKQLIVATGKGSLAIRRIQPAGKRAMETSEFLRGHSIPPGSRFESASDE